MRWPVLFLVCCLCAAGDSAQVVACSGMVRQETTDAAVLDRAMVAVQRFWAAPPASDAAVGLVRHRVRTGETWTGLGRRYRVAGDFLRSLNPGVVLRSGAVVRVLDLATVPLRLEVRLHAFRLLAWRGAVLIGVFPIGIGTPDHPTPLGGTTVAVCARNPDWRDPVSRRVYRAGDARNVLGGYWISFALGDGRFRGIGIHGYTAQDPARWLNRPGSRGCIRLRQADIARVFTLVRPGVRVVIRE